MTAGAGRDESADPASAARADPDPQRGLRRPGRAKAGLLAALGVGLVGLAAWYLRGVAAPAVPIPANLERLDPAVVPLIREHVAAVEAAPEGASAHGHLGLVYEANAFWDEARACFAAAARLDPEKRPWRFHLAIATHSAGDFEAALHTLRELAAEPPAVAAYEQRLGEWLLEAGELDAARAAFERVVDLAPERAEGHLGLGDALLRRGRPADAASSLERALALDFRYGAAHYVLGSAYRTLGRERDAARELALGVDAARRFLPDELSEDVRAYAVNLAARLDQAQQHLTQGRPEQAVRLLEQALVFRPEHVTLLNDLGIAYLHAGRLEQGFETLSRALRLDEARFSTYVNLASWAQRSGRPQAALRYARAAVERGPRAARARFAEASALARLGDLENALTSLREARRLAPRDPEVPALMADLCARLERVDEAAGHYRDALEIWPALLPAQLGLASLELRRGRLDEAEAVLDEARRTAPTHPRLASLARRVEAARRK